MTIPLIGTGGHFTRVGKIGKSLNDINTFRGNSGTAGNDWQAIFAQFATADQDVVDRLWAQLATLQKGLAGPATYLQGIAQTTTQEMAQDDKHLDDPSLKAALAELIRQMKVSADFVKQPTVSVAVTNGNGVSSNTGDGVCIATVLDAAHVQTDYAFNETLTAICSNDSQQLQSAATVGKEPFQVLGQVFPTPDALDSTWPIGSGASLIQNAVTATDDAVQSTTLLTNGDFEGWVSAVPNNWITNLGAGTISKGTGSNAYRGSGSLAITGDGATLTSLQQAFNTSGQTVAKLAPLTVYGLNFWIKKTSGLAAGVLVIDLIDSTNTVVQDAGGNNLTLSITLSGLTTSFVAHNVFFRTPAALPQSQPVALRIRLTTAATNAQSFYIDDVTLSPAVQAYNGGPFFALFSGAIPFIEGDQFNLAVSNDYSSAWQKALDRLYGMRDLGLIVPSTAASGSVTISDGLLS